MNDVLRWPVVALVGLVLTVGACVVPGSSRVSGVVTIGPTCPSRTCPDRPAPGITIIFAGTSTEKSSVVTDSTGAYAITLAPGNYDVTLNGPNPAVPQVIGVLDPLAGPANIHTSSGQELRVNYRLFSGIA